MDDGLSRRLPSLMLDCRLQGWVLSNLVGMGGVGSGKCVEARLGLNSFANVHCVRQSKCNVHYGKPPEIGCKGDSKCKSRNDFQLDYSFPLD